MKAAVWSLEVEEAEPTEDCSMEGATLDCSIEGAPVDGAASLEDWKSALKRKPCDLERSA